jgi:hypothetical protein
MRRSLTGEGGQKKEVKKVNVVDYAFCKRMNIAF